MTIFTPGAEDWKDILRGGNFDPADDQQANSSLDLVGSSGFAMLQGQISGTGDDSLVYLRARLGDSSPTTSVYLGLDINNDGRIDVFVEAKGGNSPYVSFHASDPSKDGSGPSNTGWLSSQTDLAAETQLAEGNFYFEADVPTGPPLEDYDLDGNDQIDSWVQFGFSFSDLKAFVALTMGGDPLTVDSPITIYTFTSTSQTANGDLGGVDDGSGALNQTWTELGIGLSGSLTSIVSGAVIAPTITKLVTGNTTPLLKGTWGGDQGGDDSLAVTVNGVTYYAGEGLTINGTNWSVQLPALSAGTYSVTAVATRHGDVDISQTDTTTNELTITAAGPTAPTVTAQTSGSATPTITGTWGGTNDGTDTLSVTVDGHVYSGDDLLIEGTNWSLTLPALPNGSYEVAANVTRTGDPDIRVADSSSDELTIAAAPTVTEKTSDTAATTISGTWGGSNGGTETLTVTVNGIDYSGEDLVIDGTSWSLELPSLPNGTYEVSASVSRDGTPLVDTSARELVIAVIPTVDEKTSDNAAATISGTWGGSKDGTDTLTITVDDIAYTVDNGLVIEGNTWSLVLPELPNSTYEVVASVTGSGGTLVDVSSQELTIAVEPTATVQITSVEDDVAGTIGTVEDGGITNDTTPVINGTLSATLAAWEKVAVYANGELVGYAQVDGTTWTILDSEHETGNDVTYTAKVVNPQLQSGPVSDPYTVSIVVVDSLGGPFTISDNDGPAPVVLDEAQVTTDTSPLVSGTLPFVLAEGEVLQLLRDGEVIGTATLDGLNWTYQDTGLVAGETYAYTVRVASGDEFGPESAPRSIIIFAGTPDTPTVDPVEGSESAPLLTGTWGGSNDGNDTLTVTVNGVEYTEGNGLEIDGDTWTLQLPFLDDDTYEVTAEVERLHGGTAIDTTTEELLIDTTPPETTATIDSVTDDFGPAKGQVADGDTTDDLTPTLGGALSDDLLPGEKVAVLRDGEVIGFADVDGTRWTFEDPDAPNETTVVYSVAVWDKYENKGEASEDRSVSFLSNAGIAATIDASGLDIDEGTAPAVNGRPATTPFTFVITFSKALRVAADVTWSVLASGAAPVEIEDFVGYGTTFPKGTIHVEAGETEATVTINVRADAIWALDQTFELAVSTTDPCIALPDEDILGVIRNDDALNGTGAGDRLTAGGSVDTVFGFGGDDVLRGAAGDDLLYGGTGNDTIDGGAGNDLIEGDAGFDVVDYSNTTEGVFIDLGDGYNDLDGDTLPAAFGLDTLSSIEGVLTGSGGDLVLGSTGANFISTGAGNDTIAAEGGNDTINGGTGWDILTYAASTVALNLNLALTSTQNTGAGRIILSGIEHLFTGSGNDTLTGDAAANRFDSGAGDDSLNGGAGADTFVGGEGNDTFIFSDAGDWVLETEGQGTDLVLSAVTTTLDDNVENLTLTGIKAISGTGNELGNLLVGNSAANTLSGLAGDDTLSGEAGADTLLGGAGNDVFILSSVSQYATGEVITGGNGIDELRFAATSAATLVLRAGVEVERVTIGTGTGTAADSTGTAAVSIDAAAVTVGLTLVGNAGANGLTGTAYGDALLGGGGNDTLIGGAGTDTLDGGAGFDVADYSAASSALVLSLADTGAQPAGTLGSDTFVSVEALLGGTGNDSLTGESGANLLSGGAGDDTLAGGLGDDTLNGGAGTDTASYATSGAGVTVSLDTSAAQNTGGAGTDTLLGIERLVGSGFADTLGGNGVANRIDGGTGADTITGGAGADTLLGGAGNDLFVVTLLADYVAGDTVDGGADTDELRIAATSAGTLVLTAGTIVERVVIGTGTAAAAVSTGTTAINVNAALAAASLTLVGNAGANILTGSNSADTIDGGAGNDIITGGTGDDSLDGGLGFDVVSYATASQALQLSLVTASAQSAGAFGSDILVGFEGIEGGLGNDSLTGNAAANLLSGGAGDDLLDGAAGNDTLNGNDGSDTVTYASAGAAITVNLTVTNGQNTGAAGTDTLISVENVTGSAYNDLLTGNASANRLEGGLGQDTIIGGSGADRLAGDDGDDLFILSNASDFAQGEIISGGSGTDELRFAASSAATLVLTASVGVERVVIGTGTAASAVSSATTSVNVNAAALGGAVTLIGNAGANILTGTGYADRIEGNAGSDTLIGGDGGDTLVGGLGNDRLTGGFGADVFIFDKAASSSNRDTITDFQTGQDHIALTKSVFAGLTSIDTLADDAFWAASNATTGQDATDRVIYNTTTGALYYDADGSGAGAAVQIAQLSSNLTLTADDFLIY